MRHLLSLFLSMLATFVAVQIVTHSWLTSLQVVGVELALCTVFGLLVALLLVSMEDK